MNALLRKVGWEDLREEKKKEIVRKIYEEQSLRAWETIAKNNDALILCTLVDKFGFDKHDCRRLFEAVSEERVKIGKNTNYGADELAINDVASIVLKNIGVDIEYWRERKKQWKPEEDVVWMSREDDE